MQNQQSAMQAGMKLTPATIVICLFVVVPITLIVCISFTSSSADGSALQYGIDNYRRLASPLYLRQTLYSVMLGVMVVLITLLVTVPFTYFLSAFKRRIRTILIVFILAQMSLSEVLISFGWQVLLARTTGVTNLLVFAGLLDAPFSMVPSFQAVLIALVYLAIPFSVLIMFPVFSRLDRNMVEAARTMGASQFRAFTSVVLPACRGAIITTGLSLYILTLGSVIVPQLLGNPRNWTLAVHITNTALNQYDPPFAAAIAVVLLAISVLLALGTWLFSRRKN